MYGFYAVVYGYTLYLRLYGIHRPLMYASGTTLIMAGQNLAIAQHRDTLRYAQVRSGAYQPRLTKFAAGDFVYLRRPTSTALHMRVRPTIYNIYQVRASGRVVLQGKCGSFLKSHLSHLTPCHLANIDSTVSGRHFTAA
jgi:hypothetical protein